jgi:hypothetical protein
MVTGLHVKKRITFVQHYTKRQIIALTADNLTIY